MAVVPVYNMITVPDSSLYMQTEVYRTMTGRAPVENEKVTVIVAKKRSATQGAGKRQLLPHRRLRADPRDQ
jgi:hypothetical protein